jgi:hypothetical protein
VRGPFSTFGISDFNVERALGGRPLEPPKPNRVVGGKGSSMIREDRTALGLPDALRQLAFGVPRRDQSSVFTSVQLLEIAEISQVFQCRPRGSGN